jgi:phosphoribosylformylglycinamidine synthase
MSSLMTVRGTPAFSDFRREKLLALCREQVPEVASLFADLVHFIDASPPLTEDERTILYRLLEYGPSIPLGSWAGSRLVVVPRPGMSSPWSSKATEITHRCGLRHMRRMERAPSSSSRTSMGCRWSARCWSG